MIRKANIDCPECGYMLLVNDDNFNKVFCQKCKKNIEPKCMMCIPKGGK